MTTSKNVLAYAKRKDRNHKDAVSTVKALGYYVSETSGAGGGFPDILVVSKKNPKIIVLFEIKVDNEALRDKEAEFFSNYPGLAFVVRSGESDGQEAGQQIVRIMQEVESGRI